MISSQIEEVAGITGVNFPRDGYTTSGLYLSISGDRVYGMGKRNSGKGWE